MPEDKRNYVVAMNSDDCSIDRESEESSRELSGWVFRSRHRGSTCAFIDAYEDGGQANPKSFTVHRRLAHSSDLASRARRRYYCAAPES